jgi:phosphate transport system substrate-binding protein
VAGKYTVARSQRRGRPPLVTVLRAGAAAALLGLVAACGAAAAASPTRGSAAAGAASEPPGTLSETGSSLLFPLAQAWAQAYHRENPAVTVTTASTGSGTGIKDATNGSADIGASDAFLSSGDLVKNTTLLNIPLAISAQTVIYNLPQVSASTHIVLDGTVLAGIYRGQITTWDDPAIKHLNKGMTLPSTRIVPVHRKDSSGDTFLFTSYLSTQNRDWDNLIGYGTKAAWPPVAVAQAVQGSSKVLQACTDTPGCVAYNGISYLGKAQAAGLGEAQLANAYGNAALPTPTAVKDAVASFVSITPPNETISMIDGPATDGYPIVNYEYAVVSTRQPSTAKAKALRDFLTWVITTGNEPAYLSALGFQPLPADIVTLAEAQIAEIGS